MVLKDFLEFLRPKDALLEELIDLKIFVDKITFFLTDSAGVLQKWNMFPNGKKYSKDGVKLFLLQVFVMSYYSFGYIV